MLAKISGDNSPTNEANMGGIIVAATKYTGEVVSASIKKEEQGVSFRKVFKVHVRPQECVFGLRVVRSWPCSSRRTLLLPSLQRLEIWTVSGRHFRPSSEKQLLPFLLALLIPTLSQHFPVPVKNIAQSGPILEDPLNKLMGFPLGFC
jgi:hypothetical protein